MSEKKSHGDWVDKAIARGWCGDPCCPVDTCPDVKKRDASEAKDKRIAELEGALRVALDKAEANITPLHPNWVLAYGALKQAVRAALQPAPEGAKPCTESHAFGECPSTKPAEPAKCECSTGTDVPDPLQHYSHCPRFKAKPPPPEAAPDYTCDHSACIKEETCQVDVLRAQLAAAQARVKELEGALAGIIGAAEEWIDQLPLGHEDYDAIDRARAALQPAPEGAKCEHGRLVGRHCFACDAPDRLAKPPPPEAAPEDGAEREIQDAFKSRGYPAESDLAGWQRNSGEWQAAWAGAHKHRAQLAAQLAAAQARVKELTESVTRVRLERQAATERAEKAERELATEAALRFKDAARANAEKNRADAALAQRDEAVALLREGQEPWNTGEPDWDERADAFLSRLDAAKPKQEGK